ncbi:restriction endonuclease subunit S [Allobaculum mucilyticum]|uniref:restriction endonuclease subunit S n=1 Tax=Allobaculum mucilyticum TaxID=2834459 RepID=UPI001E532A0E|nr:restriction endonuclease subunit S [Allobaculum mucilyticum]UNT97123.1 restriction endonuclease subunit S [Allobaculum mucilyticum]
MKFKTARLGEVLSAIIDYRGKTPHKSDTGIPVVSAKCVKNGRLDMTSAYYISEEEYSRFMVRGLPQRGDLLITTEASLGEVAILEDPSVGLAQRVLTVRGLPGVLDTKYLYYYLRTTAGKARLTARESGTTVSGIKQSEFRNVEISFPEYSIQQKIVGLLSSLDSCIANNDRINKNLAEQIQAFLNYVLSTGNENDAVRFGDLLYIKGRIGWKGLKKDEYLANSDYRIINGESLTPEGIDWTKTGFITQERYDESPEIMLKLGDILLSKDGTIGKIGYIDKLDLPTTVTSGIFVIRNSTKGEYGTPFLYYLLTSNRFKGFIKARTEGSVIPHLYQKDFMEFTFPKPDPELLKQFNEFSQPLFETIQNKIRENRQLAILRDKLLAKLLSGDIEIQ